jgi:hypothetical protein
MALTPKKLFWNNEMHLRLKPVICEDAGFFVTTWFINFEIN